MQTQHAHGKIVVAWHYVIDASTSMEAPDRMPIVKTVLKQRLAAGSCHPQDMVALSTFASRATPVLSFTPVRSALSSWSSAIDAIRTGGATAMNDALFAAIGSMRAARGFKKTIVLLTDGAPYPEPRETCLQRIASAQKFGIRIHTIGFGASADEDLLRKLARGTGGTYSSATTLQQLAQAFRAAA